MPNIVEMIVNFLLNNLIWIIPLCVIGFLAYRYFSISRKTKLKPIDRAEIERLKFIERMKFNKTNIFKWFKRGETIIGRIEYARNFDYPVGNPDKPLPVIQMCIKPYLFSIGRIRLTNPIAKLQCFQIDQTLVTKDAGIGEMSVEEWTHFDKYFGVYYDSSQEKDHTQIIKQDNIMRTDLENLASIYFVKAQEQSTFDPERAHRLAIEQKRIETELAKRKGKAETV